MNKLTIEEQLATDKSLRIIAEELDTSQTNLRYWIKKYELTRTTVTIERCKHCDRECNKTYCSTKCKSLFSYYKNKIERDVKSKVDSKNKRESFKKEAIQYGGGSCRHCNYNTNYSALSFHHTDPTKKDFPLSGIKALTLKEDHKKELDKCILLCQNCHTSIHNTLRELQNKPKNKQAIKGQRVRRDLIKIKGECCQKCNIKGINDIFAFHHLDESTKEFEIDARVCNGYKYERLLKEVNKCILLCHNCHMELHYPQNIL